MWIGEFTWIILKLLSRNDSLVGMLHRILMYTTLKLANYILKRNPFICFLINWRTVIERKLIYLNFWSIDIISGCYFMSISVKTLRPIYLAFNQNKHNIYFCLYFNRRRKKPKSCAHVNCLMNWRIIFFFQGHCTYSPNYISKFYSKNVSIILQGCSITIFLWFRINRKTNSYALVFYKIFTILKYAYSLGKITSHLLKNKDSYDLGQ